MLPVVDGVGFGGQFGYDQCYGNFYQLGARNYDAAQGRFLTRDPIGFSGGPNLYAYCGNNPVTRSDPGGTNGLKDWAEGLLRKWFLGSQNTGTTLTSNASELRREGDDISSATDAGSDGGGDGILEQQSFHEAQAAPKINAAVNSVYESAAESMAAPVAPEESAGAEAVSVEGKALLEAEPVGSALKADRYHRVCTFMRDYAAFNGEHFHFEPGKTLTQIPGDVNGVFGRFEYIVNSAGELTHQMFVPGGAINGIPIVK